MKKKTIVIIILLIFIGVSAYGVYYVNDYYHANNTAMKYLNGTYNVTVDKMENGLFIDGPGNDTALIFYPGAKVEYTSYLPLLTHLSERGVDCFLIKMPLNLAFLGEDSADKILTNYKYDHYYLSGHSLGGVMASDYSRNSDKITGLILFGSYPTKTINKPVLSIYGSEDRVLNLDKYYKSRPLMGKNLTEVTIYGGNHAQVGDYGNQTKDGTAKISPQRQQELSVDAMTNFINRFN